MKLFSKELAVETRYLWILFQVFFFFVQLFAVLYLAYFKPLWQKSLFNTVIKTVQAVGSLYILLVE